MATPRNTNRMPEYLGFDLEIGKGQGREHPVAILASPAGESRGTMHFPFDRLALENHLQALELALARSTSRSRRIMSPDAERVQSFGQALMDHLLAGNLRSTYEESVVAAKVAGKRLRMRLRIQEPGLATLPWEFLYDRNKGEFAVLSRSLSVVRYLEMPSASPSLTADPPLRILAMAAGPSDLPTLDASNERQRLTAAVANLVAAGLVEVTWMESGSWRELQRQLRGGPWHIFHFIGHGGFSAATDEGVLAFTGDDGKHQLMGASQVGRLLADHPTLRLVVLNSCQGAEGSSKDLVSSTSAALVERGIPAVIGMQYEISDDAAIEFSRGLYEALADEQPVDAAVSEARIAVSMALPNTLEWGTPVLFMRATEGALFRLGDRIQRREEPVVAEAPAPTPAAVTTVPEPDTMLPQPGAPAGVDEPSPLVVGDPIPVARAQAEPIITAQPEDRERGTSRAAPGGMRIRLAVIVAALLLLVGGSAAIGLFAVSRGGKTGTGSGRLPQAASAGTAGPAAVTAPAAASPGPGSPTPAATGSQQLWSDDLTDADEGLLPVTAAYSDFPDYTQRYGPNGFDMKATVSHPAESVGVLVPLSYNVNPPVHDQAEIGVNVSLVTTAKGRLIGLICGDYIFELDPSAGRYRLTRQIDSREVEVPLQDWTPSSAIHLETEVNRLAMRCAGGMISVGVNGVALSTVADTAGAIDGLGLGIGVSADGPLLTEALFSALTIRDLTGEAAVPAPGWVDGAAFPARAAGQPAIAGLHVQPATVGTGGHFTACYNTLAPGTDRTTPLILVASDGLSPAPQSPTDSVVIGRSPAVTLQTGGGCAVLTLDHPLVPLHTTRVSALFGTATVASISIENPLTSFALDTVYSLTDPSKGNPLPTGTFSNVQGSSYGYAAGGYAIQLPSVPSGSPPPGGSIPLPGTASSGTLGVVEKFASANFLASPWVSVACRETAAGAYVVSVGATGTVLVEKTYNGNRSSTILMEALSAAVNPGTSLNKIVLRCVGDSISVAINNREVFSFHDTEFSSGTFQIGAGSVDENGLEADFSSLVYAPP